MTHCMHRYKNDSRQGIDTLFCKVRGNVLYVFYFKYTYRPTHILERCSFARYHLGWCDLNVLSFNGCSLAAKHADAISWFSVSKGSAEALDEYFFSNILIFPRKTIKIVSHNRPTCKDHSNPKEWHYLDTVYLPRGIFCTSCKEKLKWNLQYVYYLLWQHGTSVMQPSFPLSWQ